MAVSLRDGCALVLLLAGSSTAQAVRYGTDVRPILARNCFACHGPDENSRKAKLRLDVPGQAAQVPIAERITSQDPDDVMPHPRSGKSLTPDQIATLRRWVEQGARYEAHWSFVAPRRPGVPRVEGVEHPVDRFVRAWLPEGLAPSPPADRTTLVRRVYLDLIGLPPTPEEADAFVKDPTADAYERLVDRLLASPHYGERWARRWLDLARYADTNGYEKDRDRSIWPYRDWVIRAYNEDLPFDRFVVEQIAGDLLPNATAAQRIATGFHRNTMLNEEGGIDPLEFRFHAMTDRVATTGTVFLGLTVGCAQCHSHKFDAITHRDFYGMLAFLDNADELDFEVVAPRVAAAHRQRLAEAERALTELEARWPEDAPALETELAVWLAEHRAASSRWTTLHATEATANLPRLVVDESGVVNAHGDTTKHDVYRLRFAPVDHEITAVRLEALPDDRLPAGGPGMTYYEGRKGDFFLSEFELVVDGARLEIGTASESYAKNQFGKHPVSAARTLDGDVQTGWSIAGGVGARHVAVFELEQPIAPGRVVELTMHFGRHFASSLGRFRCSATAALRGDATATMGEELDRLLAIPADQLSEAQRQRLRRGFLLQSERMATHARRIRALRRPPKHMITLVMRERPPDHRRVTHRHHRGEYLQPKEPVAPSVPGALHPLPDGAPRDRLGFAHWLVARDNPLAARVAVNRHWAALFGTGLVSTVEDFGVQGELPSHPQLLDWLAVEFMAKGWSIKQLHRLLVTSATYRQASRVRPMDRSLDPQNRWLARAPRFRLAGEILRDGLLRAAGMLETEMFGPPVRPPQPDGVTEVAYGKPRWKASEGAARYRRSIYTFQKRTAPFAFYETFDAPSGETSVARRDRSNTPLQALTLLNDPMVMEIARGFAERMARHTVGLSDDQAVERAFRLVLTRRPTPAERQDVAAFLARQRGRRDSDEAAWTAIARALFALDETMTRN